MSKITSKNIFENKKYGNILTILDAYPNGLEFKHLAYILLGEKRLIKEKYLSRNSITGIKDGINKKRKDYQISNDVPKNVQRLAECLYRLEKLGFIKATQEKKISIKKYQTTHLLKAISTAKKTSDKQDKFIKNLYRLTETKRFLMDISRQMEVYVSSEYAGKYKNSKKVKEAIERFQREVKNLLRDLETLSKESHELWKEKDYCSWVDLKPFLTIVIHFPPINSEEFLFDSQEILQKAEE